MNGLPTEGSTFPDKTTCVEVMSVSSLGQGWTTSIFSILLCVFSLKYLLTVPADVLSSKHLNLRVKTKYK